MSTTLASDFKIYNAEFQAGLWEGITQFVQAFNAASANCVRLVTADLKGEYAKQAVFTNISNMITRRDLTSVAAAAGLAMAQDEIISVKVARKIGPLDSALDAFRKISSDQREISLILGKMVGEKKAQDLLNTGVLAVAAALAGQSAAVYDAVTLETTKTLHTALFAKGLNLLGDMSERVRCWVMHSKCYFDLVGSQITDKVTNVADRVIYGASPGSLNRPVIISDIPALINEVSGETTTYEVLGLVEDGVVITESEQSEIVSQIVTGNENLIFRMQGEYAFNLGCKGYKWNTTAGGANPTDVALATTTNWETVYTSVKDRAGISIKVN